MPEFAAITTFHALAQQDRCSPQPATIIRQDCESTPRPAGRRIGIGDIRGCAHALEAVLEAIAPQPADLIICLGDVIDTGRDTRDAVQRLIRSQDECQLVFIRGNHEEMLLAALENPKLQDGWLNCGGLATINLYTSCGTIADIDPGHIEFIRGFRDFYEVDSHRLVHANYDPDQHPDQFPPHTPRWSLLDAPQPRAHVSGKVVVVGHTEQRDGEILDLDCVICIDTDCHFCGWLTALDLDTGETWQASR